MLWQSKLTVEGARATSAFNLHLDTAEEGSGTVFVFKKLSVCGLRLLLIGLGRGSCILQLLLPIVASGKVA